MKINRSTLSPDQLRKEIAYKQMEQKVNPVKDTNVIAKLKKQLAAALTQNQLKVSQPK